MPAELRTPLASISPFFMVRELQRTLAFYRDQLGFHIVLELPEPEPFFAILRRGSVQLFVKVVEAEVEPLANRERDPNARWDAFVLVTEPDALARELAQRDTAFLLPLEATEDGLRGFEVQDPDGHVLFFGCPLEQVAPARVVAVQPVLMVRDVARALAFYARLGFAELFRDAPEPRYAGTRRQGADLHLQWQSPSAWDQPGDRPSYRFVVPDVDALFDEYRSLELDRNELSDTSWGTREFHVRDPDGNVLQFYRNL
jgi:catechol 2,3-dioxygenase-like lactoylglutathione lyase family enzyme